MDYFLDFFLARGCPGQVVREALNKCEGVSHSESLVTCIKETRSKIPLVLPFCKVSKAVTNIVHKNVRLLSSDPDIGFLFADNVITAYKNSKSIRDTLVRSRLPSSEIPGTFTCGRSRCVTCDHVIDLKEINGPCGTVKVFQSFDCRSKGVIYCISCLLCSMLYVGETGRMLGERFREHLSDIRVGNSNSSVACHFNSGNHNIDHAVVSGMRHVANITTRRLKESQLIKSLGTLHPQGLNQEDDSNYKLSCI